mmetsp:Transcript_53926/g.89732  ORF Transcript_53926/g.89732 Transcript_53926/m.89732 type:complete len:218 (+) Transcript_53926:178-831(+)
MLLVVVGNGIGRGRRGLWFRGRASDGKVVVRVEEFLGVDKGLHVRSISWLLDDRNLGRRDHSRWRRRPGRRGRRRRSISRGTRVTSWGDDVVEDVLGGSVAGLWGFGFTLSLGPLGDGPVLSAVVVERLSDGLGVLHEAFFALLEVSQSFEGRLLADEVEGLEVGDHLVQAPHLTEGPARDVLETTDLLEDGGADAEVLGSFSDGQVEEDTERLKRE